MKRIFTAAIAVAAVALAGTTQVRATTFPSLTPIYFASGAINNSVTASIGISTLVNCSNLSGQTASVRYQFRASNGSALAGGTLLLANLATQTVTSQANVDFTGSPTVLPTGYFYGGAIQILSTQSAVYCSAMIVHAEGANEGPQGIALHMVRFNPHPGTVE